VATYRWAVHREPATYYRERQQKWAGRMHACNGVSLLLVLILRGSVFDHWWGVLVALPLLVGFYCCARSIGALGRFLRARRAERGH
jgi:hypothetical protein